MNILKNIWPIVLIFWLVSTDIINKQMTAFIVIKHLNKRQWKCWKIWRCGSLKTFYLKIIWSLVSPWNLQNYKLRSGVLAVISAIVRILSEVA